MLSNRVQSVITQPAAAVVRNSNAGISGISSTSFLRRQTGFRNAVLQFGGSRGRRTEPPSTRAVLNSAEEEGAREMEDSERGGHGEADPILGVPRKINADGQTLAGASISPEGMGTRQDQSDWRLWSNLNKASLKHEPGSLLASILLVTGTTVGAGILALPAVAQSSGFIPSSATCVGCWVYMVVTGLMLAEVNINTMCELGSGGVSLVSMADRTIGKRGVQLSSAAYIFLHYALLVAYTVKAGGILSDKMHTPVWVGEALFAASLGLLCFLANDRVLGTINGLLVAVVLGSFSLLVVLAGANVDPSNLLAGDWHNVPGTIPVIALSFVYQNVVPVICTSLEGDIGKIRKAIVIGTAIPLVMFIAWDAAILGSVPPQVAEAVTTGTSVEVFDPLESLRASSGTVGPTVEYFSLSAVATSFIGFVLGLADFLADGLKLPAGKQPLAYGLTLVPPVVFGVLFPDVFFKSLDVAGTYGVLVLFGLQPAAMLWSERYGSHRTSNPILPPIVPGGMFTIAAVALGAAAIIAGEAMSSLASYL